jgi:hypothetical protein
MICRYDLTWDFPDGKGWDAWLGEHAEGQIALLTESHEQVLNGDREIGFYWSGYVPNHDLGDGPYQTFEQCQRAFEEAIFGTPTN